MALRPKYDGPSTGLTLKATPRGVEVWTTDGKRVDGITRLDMGLRPCEVCEMILGVQIQACPEGGAQ